ncbi:transposase [Candidatus Methanoperedens nitratireducens]|uniref:transposase n=1 Tax=Candidatus Methanoperedens nitratireducens TaxID=1392998 RepID=UPI0015CD0370|nr:transposase [Candidatus Methanoperedens nitroreducens]
MNAYGKMFLHKKFIIATILSRDGNKIRGRFGMTLDEILKLITSKRILEKLNKEIMSRMQKLKEDLEIAMSMTGMGFTSASTILAEIGNYRDFVTAEQLASWCGLTPKVSQSADKLVTGSITKQGSKHVRRMLVQVAHAIAKSKNSKLKRFFLHILAKKGKKKAIVALIRCIGKKSSMHIASSPGEQRKISGR